MMYKSNHQLALNQVHSHMAIGFETGKVPLDFKPEPALGFTSAANSVLLPKPKPRAMREPFVVPPIRSREIAPAERSGVRHREDSLKPLDVGNSLLGVHSVQISNIGEAIVNRSDICISCLRERSGNLGISRCSILQWVAAAINGLIYFGIGWLSYVLVAKYRRRGTLSR
jgi:hypothetical protein